LFEKIKINKKTTMKKTILIILISIWGLYFQLFAQGDLLVTPKRIVFEGNKQKEILNLVNIGKDTATYKISFVQYNMKEDGNFVLIEKPDSGQMFADPYLKIFPRKVTLAPREPQVLVLQCKRKAGMLAGEYRSHLYFRAEKNNKPLGVENTDSTKLKIQLIPVYGISIPVIIHSGEVNVNCTLSDIRLEIQQDTIQNLKFTVNRTGNISVYGDFIIDYYPTQGKSYQIGIIKGVGVYTNINKRVLSIKLNNSTGKILKNGKLKIQFIGNDEAKPVTYAVGELEIK
jgi:hypothetical protein